MGRPGSARNWISGQRGTSVQAGRVDGDVHVHPPGRDWRFVVLAALLIGAGAVGLPALIGGSAERTGEPGAGGSSGVGAGPLREGAPCDHDHAVSIDAPQSADDHYEYTVTVHCDPPPGQSYQFVFEVLGDHRAASPTRYVWRRTWVPAKAGTGAERFEGNTVGYPKGTAHLLYAIRCDAAGVRELEHLAAGGAGLERLPDCPKASTEVWVTESR
ncbi:MULTISPECIES: hypothetical protein [Actinosynnema]|uniref:hypothetical protein n=1 Tax=Actinosynnema TaxID=40566 RepID=UPI0020A236FA|nr:hypothetical protein [Actinosynnema pretiosum]